MPEELFEKEALKLFDDIYLDKIVGLAPGELIDFMRDSFIAGFVAAKLEDA